MNILRSGARALLVALVVLALGAGVTGQAAAAIPTSDAGVQTAAREASTGFSHRVQLVAATSHVQAAAPAPARVHAMNVALGKLGAPYRWGAEGPHAFDCSGLVNWAFKQVGVDLPRTSRAQSKVGVPVSKAHLQPGDLVFFYHPVSHVAIYIGDGKVVHASNRRDPVKISFLDRMPFNSARRV